MLTSYFIKESGQAKSSISIIYIKDFFNFFLGFKPKIITAEHHRLK